MLTADGFKLMDGILIIDKPAGWTSHDVVARARGALREKRIGHTGTLDPFATGVLVLLIGRATRLAQFLAGAVKEYEAVVRFGYATETGDLTGERRAEFRDGFAACPVWAREEIAAALDGLRGEIEQVPPMYSAKKIQGRKLYELARRGIEVERAAVRVTIHEIEALDIDNQLLKPHVDGSCELRLRVVCSAGTYVRVLAEDLGARLKVGAHLAALRRTRAGEFQIRQAVTMENLNEAAGAGTAQQLILPPEAALSNLPAQHLTEGQSRRARHGAAVPVSDSFADGARIRLHDAEGKLIAVGVYDDAIRQARPRVMLAADDVES
ncbi:MAG: tRNA pseudouridine(55) synthase TruB [Acidobacteriota bacterium]|nr:tRNA pseudouridine(55) synthase TruB [Acidobacteriota bacterium]